MNIATKLEIPKGKKIVLLNHDDLGMNEGSNHAFKKIVESRTFNSSSVMSVCPWFPDVVEMYVENHQLNIGVHLTLTSEWKGYRWKPLSTVTRMSGLIDQDGYFWARRQMLIESVIKEAAEEEFHTQIEKVIDAGIDITHIDCHMGVGFIPELFEIYIGLGEQYKVPVLIPTNIEEILNLYKLHEVEVDYYHAIISELKTRGIPLVDHFLITPCFDKGTALEGYKNLLKGVTDGVTVLSLHPNTEECIKSIDPNMYYVRTDEYKVFSDKIDPDWLEDDNIRVISYRDLKSLIPKE